ncbi:hypothetical protein BDW22DRAFT_1348932 [Trametopsis cervina]|nr:hypothetical protein BDW22DRAFT_1348932 [Trametopsis cervina]
MVAPDARSYPHSGGQKKVGVKGATLAYSTSTGQPQQATAIMFVQPFKASPPIAVPRPSSAKSFEDYGLLSDGAYVGLPAMRRASCWMGRIEDRSQGPSDVGMGWKGRWKRKINGRSWAVQTQCQFSERLTYDIRSTIRPCKREADVADVCGTFARACPRRRRHTVEETRRYRLSGTSSANWSADSRFCVCVHASPPGRDRSRRGCASSDARGDRVYEGIDVA